MWSKDTHRGSDFSVHVQFLILCRAFRERVVGYIPHFEQNFLRVCCCFELWYLVDTLVQVLPYQHRYSLACDQSRNLVSYMALSIRTANLIALSNVRVSSSISNLSTCGWTFFFFINSHQLITYLQSTTILFSVATYCVTGSHCPCERCLSLNRVVRTPVFGPKWSLSACNASLCFYRSLEYIQNPLPFRAQAMPLD